MAACTVTKVQSKLNELLDFIGPVHSFINSHLVNFFTGNLWSECLPMCMQQELNSVTALKDFARDFPSILLGTCTPETLNRYPDTCSLLRKAQELSLGRDKTCVSSLAHLEEDLMNLGCCKPEEFKLKEFMSAKKLHEVERTSKVVSLLGQLTECSHVADIGGGKGYLSSILVLHHRLSVLGVDSSRTTTCGAVKLSQKVAKYCAHLAPSHRDKTNNNLTNKQVSQEVMRTKYKQVIAYVTSTLDLPQLVAENFEGNRPGILLSGLHTCGDLGPTCLRLFQSTEQIRALVNVGCCYHLIEEEFDQHEFWAGCDGRPDNAECGFPMSRYLRDRGVSLGRNARMLAAHSLDRLLAAEQVSMRSIFYRCILQSLVVGTKGHTLKEGSIGRLGAKCEDFHDYIRKAVELLELSIAVTDSDITALYDRHAPHKPAVAAYFLLRISFAPIVESIILLDRLLFLMEKADTQARIVQLFDPVVSPRGYGIVAWRGNDTTPSSKTCVI